jgi:hypothetical protein
MIQFIFCNRFFQVYLFLISEKANQGRVYETFLIHYKPVVLCDVIYYNCYSQHWLLNTVVLGKR